MKTVHQSSVLMKFGRIFCHNSSFLTVVKGMKWIRTTMMAWMHMHSALASHQLYKCTKLTSSSRGIDSMKTEALHPSTPTLILTSACTSLAMLHALSGHDGCGSLGPNGSGAMIAPTCCARPALLAASTRLPMMSKGPPAGSAT